MLTCGLAQAQSGQVADDLNEARAQLQDAEYGRALRLYAALLERPNLSRAELLEALRGMGVSAAATGASDQARWAFTRALTLDPRWTPAELQSPKVRGPFEAAKQGMRSASPPRVEWQNPPPSTSAGEPLTLRVAARDDALGWIAGFVVRVSAGERKETLRLPGPSGAEVRIASRDVVAPEVELSAEAVDAQGRVLTEPAVLRIAVAATSATPRARKVPSRFHAAAGVLLDPVARAVGAELGLSWSALSFLDVGVGVSPGRAWAARIAVTARTRPGTSRLRPLAQLRGAYFPSVRAWGGGLGLGGSFELGPGRIEASAVGELFSAPPPFRTTALGARLGYELDF